MLLFLGETQLTLCCVFLYTSPILDSMELFITTSGRFLRCGMAGCIVKGESLDWLDGIYGSGFLDRIKQNCIL